jgi:hypothetical protein
MPKSSSTDAAIAAARDLTNALLHPSPASPLSPISDSKHAALQKLSTIFNEITDPGPAKIPTPTTVAKTPTVPPGFEPLPISVPAALPRVPSPLSTTPSPLPASFPRVPTQPRPPAPPAPAVGALPASPTETYQARTRNAGQRRRQQHKAQRAATKQASKQNKKNEFSSNYSLNIEPKQAEKTPPHQNYLRHCQSRQFRVFRTPPPPRHIQSLHQSPSPIPPCLPMPFGPPTPLLIPAPAPPWSIPSSN